jgi:hypothetical protein
MDLNPMDFVCARACAYACGVGGSVKCLVYATSIQAYLVLLHFADIAFFFYKLKVCGNPASSKSVVTIFPTACAHFLSLCHILVILVILQTFSLLLYLLW